MMTDMTLSEALSFARSLSAKMQWLADIERLLMAAASAQQAEQEALARLAALKTGEAEFAAAASRKVGEAEHKLAEIEARTRVAEERHAETVRRLNEDLVAREAEADAEREAIIAATKWVQDVEKAKQDRMLSETETVRQNLTDLQSVYDKLKEALAAVR